RASARALHRGIQQRAVTRVVRQSFAQELEAADDRHQEIVEVVRRAAGELAHGLHLLRFAQTALGRLLFGDVARDLGESDDLAAIADRIDDHIRPEAGDVLAHAPAFGLEAAFAYGGLDAGLWNARFAVLGGVETGEMLADD